MLRRVSQGLRTHVNGVRQFHNDETSLFNIETKVAPTSSDSIFSAHVSKNWSVGDAPNGGYLMGMAISAAGKVISFRDPLTMTAYYTNKALENQPVEISVNTLNKTKGTATVSVSFTQGGVLRSYYVGTFGSLANMQGLNFINHIAPQLPPPDECFDCSSALRKSFGDQLQVANRVEFRAPRDDPFVLGALSKQKTSEASLSCWVRFADDREPCLRSMALFCDVLPPPIVGIAQTTWVPTLEYTVHFWQRPNISQRDKSVCADDTAAAATPYWMRCKYNTPIALNGMLYTDAELWSEDGTQLLATARQLAKALTPR